MSHSKRNIMAMRIDLQPAINFGAIRKSERIRIMDSFRHGLRGTSFSDLVYRLFWKLASLNTIFFHTADSGKRRKNVNQLRAVPACQSWTKYNNELVPCNAVWTQSTYILISGNASCRIALRQNHRPAVWNPLSPSWQVRTRWWTAASRRWWQSDRHRKLGSNNRPSLARHCYSTRWDEVSSSEFEVHLKTECLDFYFTEHAVSWQLSRHKCTDLA